MVNLPFLQQILKYVVREEQERARECAGKKANRDGS